MYRKPRDLRQQYESVEYAFGVICPLLGALSVLDNLGLLRWAWLFFLWLSCGHYLLYFYDVYPLLRYRPFAKGLFVFGIGMMWPVWYVLRIHKRRFT